jgi:hypothetical protein
MMHGIANAMSLVKVVTSLVHGSDSRGGGSGIFGITASIVAAPVPLNKTLR